MDDETTTLARLKEWTDRFAAERGWQNRRTLKNLSMAIAAEAAELMEHFLWENGESGPEALRDPVRAASIGNEVADILIYVLEFANVAHIDLTGAVAAKIGKNAIRFRIGADVAPGKENPSLMASRSSRHRGSRDRKEP